MRKIRPLTNSDWDDYVTIQMNAYPGVRGKREQFRERAVKMHADPIIKVYGLFEEGHLLGVMRLYDFTMKLLSTKTLVGGIGGVAVELTHKKERVAHDMVQFFVRHYRKKGACLTALYPFRADFYKRMGFGYGRKLNQYHLSPSSLPKGSGKNNITRLTSRDRYALNACYQRVLAQTNGLMENSPYLLDAMFSSEHVQIAGCWDGDDLRGYIIYQFEPGSQGHFLSNRMVVRALVYENTDALHELLTFLHSQADQVETIVLNTHEDDFHLLLSDPRNGEGLIFPTVYQGSNAQGLGIMYRVVDLPRLFTVLQEHDFGGQTCRLKLTITDSFLPENAGEWVLNVTNGRAHLQPASPPHDAAIQLDVAEFSSLVTGAADFKTLHRYGLAHISNTVHIETVHRLFFTENKPICMTSF